MNTTLLVFMVLTGYPFRASPHYSHISCFNLYALPTVALIVEEYGDPSNRLYSLDVPTYVVLL